LRTNYLNGNQPGLLFNNGDPSRPNFPFTGVPDRTLTLNEDFDEFGRLIQTLGTFDQNGVNNQGMPTWGRGYMDTPTEVVHPGAIEVWQIMNLTADTHPIHFHLVNVQLIQRQPIQGDPSGWSYTGAPIPPDDNEVGWKETVRANPGEITTVIMQFNLPNLPTAAMRDAVSPRTGGKEYVWHCHILEHEEHDMMRPLIVR
jgi:spore coat protein A